MRTYAYKKIDAFVYGNSGGNPAACLYLKAGDKLSEAEMLAIAKEHKGFVSEVIYCTPLEERHYKLRYYSSECEVEFCGHGTIACLYSLIGGDPALLAAPEITINTNKGDLTVYNDIPELDSIFISAPAPEYLTLEMPAAKIAAALGLKESAIDKRYQIQAIDAGLRTLIVPLAHLGDVLSTWPDEQALKKFCLGNGIDIILIFSFDVADPANIARSRVFAPKFGYLEDKATGSGNSAFGYYLLQHSLWHGKPVSIEQSAEKTNYNRVMLKTLAGGVLFGGGAKVKINGIYNL